MVKKIILLSLSLAVLIGFQNCGYFSTGGVFNTGLSSSCGGGVGPNTLPVFQSSFYPLFNANSCNGCHYSGGVMSTTPLADSDPSTAMFAFDKVGLDGVKRKLEGGHQGITLANIQAEFSSAEAEWVAAVGGGNCPSGDQSTSQTVTFFEATPDPNDPDGRSAVLPEYQGIAATLVFDLSEPPYNLPGVEFSIDVLVEVDGNNLPIGYSVSNPAIKTGPQTYQVTKVEVYLNNDNFGNTIFDGVDQLVRSDDTFRGLDPGTAIFVKDGEPYSNQDEWSIAIGEVIPL